MISPYVQHIRSQIGQDLLLLPSVTVLCFDEDGRVLLVRHSNHDVWVSPGGMVEPDEAPEDAARREMLEETGLVIKIRKLLGAFGGPAFRVHYQNGDAVSYVIIAYKASIVAGSLKPDGDEILEARYFSYAETKQLRCGAWLPFVLDQVHEQGDFRP